ncbi:hypothetical protein HDU88_006728 [Geranomyces variabilis]|nr:hypothetical protein HDU88_006728 [Geranomyces variabilis]
MLLRSAILTLASLLPLAAAAPTNTSRTQAAGCMQNTNKFCPVFEDNFDFLDTKVWKHEVTMSGGGNWEFEMYVNNRTNSYVKNGVLYLQPTLTADNIGADKVRAGYTMDLNGNEDLIHCTDPSSYGCSRTSDGTNIINPITSARIQTAKSFSLQFGKVEIRAQLPGGDWLWPALWMLPTDGQYGMWPASGEIDIMESRGNAPTAGPVKGSDSIGSTLHWGPSYDLNRFPLTHKEFTLPGGKSFVDDFHTFGLEWTPDGIKTSVDGQVVLDVPFDKSFWDRGAFPASVNNPWAGTGSCAVAAPFDQPFHIVMNVAVGGAGEYFPDSTPGKPWKNNSPHAALDFWNAKDQWYPSWKGDKTAMKIDYVKAWKMC